MKPAGVEMKAGEYIVKHKCENCGFKKNNKITAADNMNSIIKLAKTLAEKR